MGITREERQIKEAFIDGYLTGAYPMGGEYRQEAEEAWREHNTTNRAPASKSLPDATDIREGDTR